MPKFKLISLLFHQTPIRIMQQERGMPVIPVVDIAKAIDYNPRFLNRIIKRHPRFFERYLGTIMVPKSTGGRPAVQGLTRDGVLAILFKLSPSRVKDPDKADRILEFQWWAVDTLSAVLDGKMVFSRRKYIQTGRLLVKDVDAVKKLALAPKYERGNPAKVQALADAEGVTITTAYRYIERYREAEGIALHHQSPRPGWHMWPDEVRKIREYVRERPKAIAKEVRRETGTRYGLARVQLIMNEIRGSL